MLDRIDTTAPQEILTADGMTVRVTAAIRWRIADPQVFLESAMDPAAGVYLAVQVALRDALVGQEAEALARTARLDLGDAVTEAAVRAAADVGIEVRHVVIKDIVLPPELRAAYAQLATAKPAARPSSRRRARRRRPCGRWPTAPSCWTSRPRSRSCDWSSRCRTAPRSS